VSQVIKLVGEQVEDILRDRIISGKLNAGERIDLETLKEGLAVSGTPIRDALMALQRDGLVRILPRRGVYVSEIDPQIIREVYDVRIALEVLAVQIAVGSIPRERLDSLAEVYADGKRAWLQHQDLSLIVAHDPDIHDLLLEYSGNRIVQDLIKTLHQRIQWVRRMAGERANRYLQSFDEHKQIMRALYNGDGLQVAELVRLHLEGARDLTIECILQSSSLSPTK
jgi:GntR family transcriptional regulator, rspAB operon transcriptional repressor